MCGQGSVDPPSPLSLVEMHRIIMGLFRDCSAEDEQAAEAEVEPITEDIVSDQDLGDEED